MRKEILETKNKKYKFLTCMIEVLNIVSFCTAFFNNKYTVCFILSFIMFIDFVIIKSIKQSEVKDCEDFYKDIVKVK